LGQEKEKEKEKERYGECCEREEAKRKKELPERQLWAAFSIAAANPGHTHSATSYNTTAVAILYMYAVHGYNLLLFRQ
jgi:hypothetical protein